MSNDPLTPVYHGDGSYVSQIEYEPYTAGRYQIQYDTAARGGWWVGHRGIDLEYPAEYVADINRNRHPLRARIIDKQYGVVYGPVCPYCDEVHLGRDGSCLL